MELSRAFDWIKQHRWWVALIMIIIAGYSVGKDRALRDNERAASMSATAR